MLTKKRQNIADILPPEQEVAGSNPAGRTSFPSLSGSQSPSLTNNQAHSLGNLNSSGHQLATWERLRLLTARNTCRSEQFLALQTPRPFDFITQLWINDQFREEMLVEQELAAL